MQIVWFKRDLRIEDHAPLTQASAQGPFIPLYIIEPKLWAEPDYSKRQYDFLCETLKELQQDLAVRGQKLIIRVGDAESVFSDLLKQYGVQSIWSHQETGNLWTYARDRKIHAWVKKHCVIWYELPNNGVIRKLKSRNGWAVKWLKRMQKPVISPPEKLISVTIDTMPIPKPEEINIPDDGCYKRQHGGRNAALKCLQSFLHERGTFYTKEMSSPRTAYTSCSRLSTHIAFGTLSIREVFQAASLRAIEIKQDSSLPYQKAWQQAMRSFLGRLRWHCHFIQKLEDQPRIEKAYLHSAYRQLRPKSGNQDYLLAWKTGKTGYPMIDACMRSLIATGWLNFRMRAMLVSFAAYHLWLDWREFAPYLASLFVDYEPGIHYAQVQMQSGTTGINSIRIYNPIKQGIDQDPEGEFIKKWIPELINMPNTCIHTPWIYPTKMGNYPQPIVDEAQARKSAADKIYALRKPPMHQLEAQAVFEKHGSRKSGLKPTSNPLKKRIPVKNSPQKELIF